MHVALLLALLLLQRSVLDLAHGSFTSDEGAYGLQVQALREGRWDIDDPFLDESTDPPRTAFPNFTVQDGTVYPYVQHPLWPQVLAVADDVAGDGGPLLVTLLAGLLVPVLAWWGVGRLADGAARGPWTPALAFWLAAVSPAVVVNSSVLWAHTASAAAAGVAVVLAVARRRRADLPLAALAVALGVLLRSEGVLLAGALALVLVVHGLRRRQTPDVVAGGVVAVAAALAVVVERAWQRAILDSPIDAIGVRGEPSGRGYLADRLDGTLHVLIGSRRELEDAVLLLGVLVVVAAVVATVAVLRGDAPRARVAAGVSAGCLAAVWLSRPDLPHSGLLVVWPFAAAGFGGLTLTSERARPVLAVAVAFLVAVAATVYPAGGGVEWGGRFMSPLTVPLAAGAALLLTRAASLDTAAVRTGGVAALAGALVVGGFATTAARGARDGAAEVEQAVLASGAAVGLSDNGLTPSSAWRTNRDVAWLVVDGGPSSRTVDEALRAARDAGHDRVVAIGVPVAELERAGLTVEDTRGRLTVGRMAVE